MLDKQIRKIKFFFAFLAGTMFLLIVWGIFALQDNSFFSAKSVLRKIDYYRYKIALNRDGVIGTIANIQGVVKQPQAYVSTTTKPQLALSIPVLVYHGVLDKADDSKINLTKKKFEEQMFALKKAGYQTIDTLDLYKYLKGEINLPDNSFLITFDDGRADSYEGSDSLLRALGFKASMFVITKYSIDYNSNYYLSGTVLKKMANSGIWDIQAHTQEGHNSFSVSPTKMGHFFADRLWLADKKRLETKEEFERRIVEDFVAVKNKLSKVASKDIIAFTFPYGDYGQNETNFPEAEKLVLKNSMEHFKLLFYQNAPGKRFTSNYYLPEAANNNSFLVKRIDINPDWGGSDILQVLNNSKAKVLPYSDDFKTDRGWLTSWGKVTIDPKLRQMTIQPGSAQTGGSAVLDGTRLWQNYELSTWVNVPNQNSVYIWARFKDDQNNVACNFGQGFAHVEQTLNGVQSVIKGERNNNFILPTGDFQVGVRVNDRSIDCIINGRVVVNSTFLDPSLTTGGIGFKTWDTVSNRSLLLVKSLQVKKI